jgi:sugar fermentation stimulation protein A
LTKSYRAIHTPIQALLLERINRFACNVELNGKAVKVYLPNSGRLEELLLPGSAVILEKRRDSGKTNHDLLLVQSKRYPDRSPIWVGVDSRLPQHLLRWLVENQLSERFGIPRELRNEPRFEKGRFDLSFYDHQGFHLVETKSVNLIDADGIARFPDAPTRRGVRHIKELIAHKTQGVHAWLIFVVMRADARSFSPFTERDPAFAQILQQARDEGVNILSLMFDAGNEMIYMKELEVILPAQPFAGIWPDQGY